MNAESVAGWLDAMGVPVEVVSIGAEVDDAWCLLRQDVDGETGWEVFWREQGNRYDWARFTSEHVACFYLFGRLTWTQALRGVVGPRDAGGDATPPRGVPVPGVQGAEQQQPLQAPPQQAPAPPPPGPAPGA